MSILIVGAGPVEERGMNLDIEDTATLVWLIGWCDHSKRASRRYCSASRSFTALA